MSTNYQSTSDDPDAIRADIERTRSELSHDVNALGESITPGHMARRGAGKLKDRASSLKDHVMGSASDAGSATSHGVSSAASSVSDAGHGAVDAVSNAGHGAADAVSNAGHGAADTVAQKAKGNPLAAGLVALGAGWLVGSLLPASNKEQRAAEAVKDRAAPVMEQAQSTARQVGQESVENLKAPAQDALASVKEQAQDSVQNVKQEGQSAASDVADTAKSHASEAAHHSGS